MTANVLTEIGSFEYVTTVCDPGYKISFSFYSFDSGLNMSWDCEPDCLIGYLSSALGMNIMYNLVVGRIGEVCTAYRPAKHIMIHYK